jgi:hypothetical protein
MAPPNLVLRGESRSRRSFSAPGAGRMHSAASSVNRQASSSSRDPRPGRVHPDCLGVAHVVVPVGQGLHGLAATPELVDDRVGDAALEREILRRRTPRPPHEPPRRLDRLLDVVPEVHDPGDEGRVRLRLPKSK